MKLIEDYDGVLNEYDIEKCECGKVKLYSIDEVKLDEIYIEGPIEGESYYKIPAIDLVKECEYYTPEFILLYLPNEERYGSWDTDHWRLILFENTTWNDIKNEPVKYMNSQWERNSKEYIKEFEPIGYELIKGWPIGE